MMTFICCWLSHPTPASQVPLLLLEPSRQMLLLYWVPDHILLPLDKHVVASLSPSALCSKVLFSNEAYPSVSIHYSGSLPLTLVLPIVFIIF